MRIYNSLSFRMEEFKTIKPNEVLMYVCGPTVYDAPHIGHAKSAITFDLIRRYLEFKGYNVKLVKNYTDIDDKIIKRANERGIDYLSLSEQYIREYEEIMNILNIKPNYKNPRATEIIDFMIKVIKILIEKGYAYESNGSVYFSVGKYDNYETIFQNIEKQENEEACEIHSEERHLLGDKYDEKDFVLWKKWKEGEPYWDSPWSKGRPGWHIECSCMAINILGNVIDIHGGGLDLKSPHHKNEIAQSTAYTGEKRFANYFLHNGFVNVDNEKMSKSLGNFFLVSDVLKIFDPMVIRLFLLSSHYRHSVNYTLDNIKQSERIYSRISKTINLINEKESIENASEEIDSLKLAIHKTKEDIINAMDDDFNTPKAIASILTLIKKINQYVLERNKEISQEFKNKFFSFIEDLDNIFGLFPRSIYQPKSGIFGKFEGGDDLVRQLLNIIKSTRKQLRKKKLYELSDQIRNKLNEIGIDIEDN
ncbi:MAG: cysteine--tRNA ligase [Candidatus Lokiarchaeota archaeon]|nr:cysteine--tRNA ligase [Candidatus Lokiarchaeota archaeon]